MRFDIDEPRSIAGIIAPFIIIGILVFVAIAQKSPEQTITEDTEILSDVKYWQDSLVKPDQKWINEYGYDDSSVMAYNIRRLYSVCQQQQNQINALIKWVNEQPQWTFVDVNQEHPKYRLEKDELLILEMGDWSKAD